MAIADIGFFGGVAFGEDKVADHFKPGGFPLGQKTVHAVPAVETDHQRVVFEYAIHFAARRLQPFVCHITGYRAPLAVAKADEVRRIGQDEIDGFVRECGHNLDGIALDES
ncbi:hypothetical protein D3C76_1381040 [compost metagenome]